MIDAFNFGEYFLYGTLWGLLKIVALIVIVFMAPMVVRGFARLFRDTFRAAMNSDYRKGGWK
jgi:hypothetical protein